MHQFSVSCDRRHALDAGDQISIEGKPCFVQSVLSDLAFSISSNDNSELSEKKELPDSQTSKPLVVQQGDVVKLIRRRSWPIKSPTLSFKGSQC